MNFTDRLNRSLDSLLLALFASLTVGIAVALVNPQANAGVGHERQGTVEIYALSAVDSTNDGV
jgi:hypothetical protein